METNTSWIHVERVEGPWWSFAAVSTYLTRERDHCARAAARAVLKGDLKRAKEEAREYAKWDEKADRADERFDAMRADSDRWIGWHPEREGPAR
jgi:Holliday junction resolvase-like predicted endonuclease